MTEEELVVNIENIDIELKNAKLALAAAKRAAVDAESIYIEIKLKKERLVEELRVCRAAKVNRELTHQEKDVERFKKALPELLLKDKWIVIPKKGE